MTKSAPPKYQGIAQDLQDRIARSEWQQGEQLPSQQSLAEQYDVTLMTLRQAIQELTARGLLKAAKGRGTYVTNPSVQYRLNHLSSFTQEMQAQGIELETEVLQASHTTAEAEIATQLALSPGAPVVEITRRRRAEGRPVALQRSYVTPTTWTTIADADLETTPLYDVLNSLAGLRASRAIESLTAIQLDDNEAELLERPAGSAAMLSIRTSLDEDGNPFLVDRALLPGDTTTIQAERHAEGLHLNYQLHDSSEVHN